MIEAADEKGEYLKEQLQQIDGLLNVRGHGLMIGFDVADEYKDLRKKLLHKHKIFTGEAKPNTVRILPALTIGYTELDKLVDTIKEEIDYLKSLN